MTNNPWDEIERRVAESRLGGVTADDDDLLGDSDIREAGSTPTPRARRARALAAVPAACPR